MEVVVVEAAEDVDDEVGEAATAGVVVVFVTTGVAVAEAAAAAVAELVDVDVDVVLDIDDCDVVRLIGVEVVVVDNAVGAGVVGGLSDDD